jgi:SAM-dependent methyltransferase
VTKGPDFSPEYFNQWYANMADTGPADEIAQRHLGLPASLLSTSLLTWDGIADVVEALRLPVNGILLDVACGRGGYGLEIAARTGGRLIGVDHSAEAIRQSIDNARAAGASAHSGRRLGRHRPAEWFGRCNGVRGRRPVRQPAGSCLRRNATRWHLAGGWS